MVGPEMLVAAAVNQVARKINEVVGLAQGEVKLCCSFSDDLESIKDTLVYMEGLLKNAENNSFGSERANLRHWLGQIKSLAYDIEDIVDGYYSSKEQYEGNGYAQKGSLLCSLSNPMVSKVSMVYKMKSKRELLQTRQHLPTQYHFISHINSVVNFDEKQTTSYRNNDIQIVGRDHDLECVMDILLQKNVRELITIISVVGPLGLGKTSLAQLIFNDTRAETFRFRIWVHVSMGNINLEKIGRDIVLQTTERIEGSMQMQSIKNAVQDILNRYSCLIVLDSLWGKDEEVNELKQMLLTCRKTESKIIVTTHSRKVADLIATVPPYKLSVLSEDDCSSIFSQRALTGYSDPLFREYGEEIVRRCEGIPLVANFLGSVVNAQRQRREIWKAAKDKDMWKIEEDFPQNKILPLFSSFKIIYYSMPHELRLCFVYCSIFPKGYVIDKKKLIQQWIALDMIESKHGTLPLDVTAEKYIDELKDIYFLQVLERTQINAEISNNSDEMLCMNNLAHDLARSVAGEDILVILDAENERCSRNYDYRYAQVSASSLQSIDSKAWPSKARSLIFQTSGAELQHVSKVLSVNKYLRVLDLSGCSVKELPAPVFQLKQLRYLDASTLPITDLPPQISGFHKLQTLDLSETEVTELPAFIGDLKRLNYLNLQGCKKLQQLNNLDLLHELHYLNLSCCPEVRRFPASLENLRKLRFFNLSECSKLPTLPDELLQSFSSFSSLVDLNLSGFEFRMLPDFFGNICSLQFLNLSKCSKLELLPQSFGQLAYLKALNLSFCSDLKLPECFEFLTSLQILDLSHCPSVEYLPCSFDKLSNLEYLNLSQCVGLKALPKSLSNHKKLQIEVFGCQDYILQSCSLSSGSCQSHQCSQQTEKVGTSSAISDTTPKEPANRDNAEGISASDADEIDHPRNLKQKMEFAYHMDEQKSEEPKFINKPNSNGEVVQVIPGNQFSSSPPRFSSVASSSSVVFASDSSSDASVNNHPLSNDETADIVPVSSELPVGGDQEEPVFEEDFTQLVEEGMEGKVTKEFEFLTLDGSNFPSWAMDVKVQLSTLGLYRCIDDTVEGTVNPSNMSKFSALKVMRNHIHPDLKMEYMYEEDPRVLWTSLKNRYEQHKAIVLPEAMHEWNHLRLQDFKTVDEFNHAVHKICSKLRFCEREPTEADKIEKTLSTMLPSERIITQQYREKNFTVYSSLIQTLKQAEKNHELTVWNSNQRPLGTVPLPEVHANAKKNGPKGNIQTENSSSKGKRKRAKKPRGNVPKGKGISKPKNESSNKIACFRCGCNNHIAKKCRTPKHLVELYMKSVGRTPETKKYEAHFASQALETRAMDPIPHGAGTSNTKTPPSREEDFMDVDRMLVEYTSNDTYGDLI